MTTTEEFYRDHQAALLSIPGIFLYWLGVYRNFSPGTDILATKLNHIAATSVFLLIPVLSYLYSKKGSRAILFSLAGGLASTVLLILAILITLNTMMGVVFGVYLLLFPVAVTGMWIGTALFILSIYRK